MMRNDQDLLIQSTYTRGADPLEPLEPSGAKGGDVYGGGICI